MDPNQPSQPANPSVTPPEPPVAAALSPAELDEQFGIPGVLRFSTRGQLVCAEITTPSATASLALQGAHLIEWQPAGQAPVLFLSDRSEFAPRKAIRGGVPVIWPWFGPRTEAVSPAPPDAPASPSHGFARTSLWQLQFAALSGEDLHLSLTLAPTSQSRAFGFAGFRVAYQLVIGRSLSLRLAVANDGPEPLRFEEALHSYLAVSEVEQAHLSGLEQTEYLDKRDVDGDQARRKREGSSPLRLTGSTDRVYLATESTCTITDPDLGRQLLIEKTGSRNTVVWNPWVELTRDLKDMAPEGWRTLLCVETANVGDAAITLAPGEAHTMSARLQVQPLADASQPTEKGVA